MDEIEKCPYIVTVVTAHGGHIAFLKSSHYNNNKVGLVDSSVPSDPTDNLAKKAIDNNIVHYVLYC